MPPIRRLLIANRGEIALRIARTARERGIETVAVHAPEDAELATGYGADRLVALSGRGAAAYLDPAEFIRIARAESCDALHPGYGFLSESADLAQACAEAGLTFVGPSPDALSLFGDKNAARTLATEQNVPVVPGIAAPASVEDVERFLAEQPEETAILLKAVSGGGGRGMRRVARGEDVAASFERCASEAERAFGVGTLYAERLVEQARHIEIQIVADASGAIGHLWERDCSLQRRHQKLVEIAPAPELPEALRDRLIDAARALAKAAGFVGVGTFEFLVGEGGEAFFMEANPRLQVEHTVTEQITGVDLVDVQLALAEGRSLADLGLDRPPPTRGRAVQLRVLAETLDADGEARPSGTTITTWRPPSGPGIRLDAAIREGLAPHPAFDSLIAKLIVSAEGDPSRLPARLARALEEFRVEGPETNLDWLAAVVARPETLSGAATTGFVGDHAAALAEAASARRAARAERDAPANDESATRPVAVTEPVLADGQAAIRAPLIGTVLEWNVEVGDAVQVGDALAVLESMKMEHVIEAGANGTVAACFAEIGDVVAEHQMLLALAVDGDADGSDTARAEIDLDATRPDLEALRAREALLQDAARPEAVERRRSRGQRTARENLAAVCDEGSFSEYGGLAIAAMKKVRPVEELQAKTPGDAILTGTGRVNGDLFDAEAARCALLVVDATVLAGTQGFFHHKKIDRILEVAEHGGMPVIFYPEGGGGRPNDTDASDVFVAGLNITSFSAFAKLSGKVPRVAVVSGYCFAGSAAFAGCADVIIATKDACLGMGGPAMIEGGGLGVYAPKEIGPSSVQAPNGVVDVLVEDEEEAAVVAKQYLSYFQGATTDWEAPDPRILRHVIPENRRRIYDVRELIAGLCDLGSILELRRAWAPGMITALVRIAGRPVGLLANDPMHLGGAIDDEGAEKAARFLQLCDAFGLPIVSLCDTPGFMVGPDIEERQQVRKVSRLFTVGANVSVPLFCVITRKGYGLGAQAMAGGGFTAPFDTVAWPTGEIGGMGLEGAVNLGFKKDLDACATDEERNALFEKLVGVMYDKGKALNAAAALEFDAVIDPAETRDRILRGLDAFGPISKGQRNFVDTW
ncbi:MAG: carboxyl transferase domain-containing protein [Myxococcota bacterium]